MAATTDAHRKEQARDNLRRIGAHLTARRSAIALKPG
jgi:hypothetical protein